MTKKICSLEAAQSFVDALRYFLPITGLWEYAVNLAEFAMDSEEAPSSCLNILEPLREALCLFSAAHLSLSTQPVSSSGVIAASSSPAILSTVTHLAMLCLGIWIGNQLQDNIFAPQLRSLGDFLSAAKRMQISSTLSLSQKQLSEIYTEVCGHPLTGISEVSNLRSFSFQCQLSRSKRVCGQPFHLVARGVSIRLFPVTTSTITSSTGTTNSSASGATSSDFYLSGDLLLTGDALYLFQSSGSSTDKQDKEKQDKKQSGCHETQNNFQDKLKLLTGPLLLLLPISSEANNTENSMVFSSDNENTTVNNIKLSTNSNVSLAFVSLLRTASVGSFGRGEVSGLSLHPQIFFAQENNSESVLQPVLHALRWQSVASDSINSNVLRTGATAENVPVVTDTPVSLHSCAAVNIFLEDDAQLLNLFDALEEVLLAHLKVDVPADSSVTINSQKQSASGSITKDNAVADSSNSSSSVENEIAVNASSSVPVILPVVTTRSTTGEFQITAEQVSVTGSGRSKSNSIRNSTNAIGETVNETSAIGNASSNSVQSLFNQ
jgi:hypothetical protein